MLSSIAVMESMMIFFFSFLFLKKYFMVPNLPDIVLEKNWNVNVMS